LGNEYSQEKKRYCNDNENETLLSIVHELHPKAVWKLKHIKHYARHCSKIGRARMQEKQAEL
jgi:hypothetical protein